MTPVRRSQARAGDHFPATARLRAGILIAPDLETLVSLFADALAEHGIEGHFCLRKTEAGLVPLAGDCPRLMSSQESCIVVDTDERFMAGTRVLLAAPCHSLTGGEMALLRGYAELFAARAVALQELADDVPTDCGLSLRERYVLGRRMAGLAPIDIAGEAGLSIATVCAAIESAIARLGCATLAEAIAFAARRGWLAVTSLENCSSSSENSTYKMAQNG